jgi:hypothetical protein
MSKLFNKAIVLGLVAVLSAPVVFAADTAPAATSTTDATAQKNVSVSTDKAAAATEKKAKKVKKVKKAKKAKKKAIESKEAAVQAAS